MLHFIDAEAKHTELLRDTLISSKGYWGYSQEQLEQWRFNLRFEDEYVSRNTVKLILDKSEVIGFFAIVKGDKDYTHMAFSIGVKALAELRAKLHQLGIEEWKQNTSEGDSLYLLDPNGHRIELHCGTLATRLAELEKSPYKGLVWC